MSRKSSVLWVIAVDHHEVIPYYIFKGKIVKNGNVKDKYALLIHENVAEMWQKDDYTSTAYEKKVTYPRVR